MSTNPLEPPDAQHMATEASSAVAAAAARASAPWPRTLRERLDVLAQSLGEGYVAETPFIQALLTLEECPTVHDLTSLLQEAGAELALPLPPAHLDTYGLQVAVPRLTFPNALPNTATFQHWCAALQQLVRARLGPYQLAAVAHPIQIDEALLWRDPTALMTDTEREAWYLQQQRTAQQEQTRRFSRLLSALIAAGVAKLRWTMSWHDDETELDDSLTLMRASGEAREIWLDDPHDPLFAEAGLTTDEVADLLWDNYLSEPSVGSEGAFELDVATGVTRRRGNG